MFKQLDNERLVGLFILGCLLFGYPLMGLWDRPPRPGAIALLPLAIFGCWAVLIGALAWLMERSPDPDAASPGADADVQG